MTTYYGAAVYSGSAWMRLRLDVSHAVDSGGGFASVAIELRVESNYSISDSSNTGALSSTGFTSWSGSTSISHGSSGGSTLLHSFGGPITLTLGAQTTLSISGSLTGINAIPGTATISQTYVLPARAYDPPAAPTSVAVTRSSDALHTVSWTNSPTSSAPYTNLSVQRSTDGGAWATIATVAGSTASYADGTTSADHSYAWRIVANNSAGSTSSASSSSVFTTPAAPGAPTAVRSGSDISLSWSNVAHYCQWTAIYHSTDGVTFSLLEQVLTANLTTYTHTAPSSSVPHTYRVTTGIGGLESAQSSSSATVALLAAPNAPINAMATPNTGAATEATVLSWVHNPVDASPQRQWQVRRRLAGTSTWTDGSIVTSASQSVSITPSSAWSASNGQAIELQVRTWGAFTDPSPWSATGLLVLSTRPTVTIAAPGSIINTSRVTVSWAFYDAEGSPQTAWSARLLTGTGALAEPPKSGPGATSTVTFDTTVGDATSWSVEVEASDVTGLWSTTASRSFSVSYPAPMTPEATGSWDPATGTVTLGVVNPPPAASDSNGFGEGSFGSGGFGSTGFGGGTDAPETDHVDVWRSIDGGAWEKIAESAPPNSALVDYAPTLKGQNVYRIDAVSALPSVASTTVTVYSDNARAVFVNGGPGFSVACRAISNVERSDTSGLDRSLVSFEGRTYPVELAGTTKSTSLSLSTDHVSAAQRGDSTPAEWRALAELAGPHLWRDTDGTRLLVSVGKPRISRDRSGAVAHVELDMERVDA